MDALFFCEELMKKDDLVEEGVVGSGWLSVLEELHTVLAVEGDHELAGELDAPVGLDCDVVLASVQAHLQAGVTVAVHHVVDVFLEVAGRRVYLKHD